MTSVLSYLVGGTAIVAAGYKFVRADRSRSSPGVLYLCATIGLLGLATVIQAPSALVALHRIEPVPNLGRLLGHTVGILSSFCALGLVAHSLYPPSQARAWLRWPAAGLAIAVPVMTALLVSSGAPFIVRFVDLRAHGPAMACYMLVLLASIGVSSVLVAWQVGRYLRWFGGSPLRHGLVVVFAGAATGVLWGVWSAAAVLLGLLAGADLPLEAPVSFGLGVVAVALIALGGTLTTWWPGLSRLADRLRSYGTYRRIGPLWRAVREAVPRVELAASLRSRGAWAVRDIGFALYRRVIEVRDGHLALRLYFHPDVPGWVSNAVCAAGIQDGYRAAAIREAATLAAAVEAKRAGHRYRADPHDAEQTPGVPADIDAETAWLAAVAREFTGSPIVREVRHRVRAELAGTPAAPASQNSPAS